MKTKTIISTQQGATVVEFAIILPLLITLIFGIIEFGLFLYNKQVITNASREGARAGIVSRDNRFSTTEPIDRIDIYTKVREWSENHLVTFGENNFNIDVMCAKDTDEDGEPDSPCDPSTGTGCCNPYAENNCCVRFRCPLTVRVTFDYDFLFLSNFGIGPITIVANTVMELE